MATGANEETVKFKVELDPQGFRSQLMQLKQEVGLTLNAATYSLGQTAGAGAVGFNTMQRDIGALAGAVFSQRTPGQDLSQSGSILSGLVPSLTAPRSYDVEEWGKLNRDNLFRSLADTTTRAGLAIPPLLTGELASGIGAGIGAVVGGPIIGGLVGGVAGYMAGSAFGETIMEPAATRYAARRAIGQVGARFGISASEEVLQGVAQIGKANEMSGTETLSVLGAGLQTGAFGQVSGAEDFKAKFSQLMRGAKEVSRDMHIELSDSVSYIASLQESGFGTIQNAMGAMRLARTTAGLTGIRTEEALAIAQAGAAMTVGNLGMSAEYGARSNLANMEAVTLGLRNKTVDMEAVNQLGGRARAASAMTMSGLGFLEGPLGRATLLAAYDTDTGQLDPTRYIAEPGQAFRSAMENVFSGGNPMRNLLEFAGNRSRVASQASPEEVALSQVMTWETLARHIDPKGPITQEMLVGAATVMGTNPDVARNIIGTTLDPSILEARREEIRKQQARAAQLNAPVVGGHPWFGGADSLVGGIRGLAETFYTTEFPLTLSDYFSPNARYGSIKTQIGVLGDVASGAMGTARGFWANLKAVGLGRRAPVSMLTKDMYNRFRKNSLAENLAMHGRVVDKAEYERAAADANDVLTAVFSRSAGSLTGLSGDDPAALAADPDMRAAFTKSLPQILALREAKVGSEEANDLRNKLLIESSKFSSSQEALFNASVEAIVSGEGTVQNNLGWIIERTLGSGVAKMIGGTTGIGQENISALSEFASIQMSGETAQAGLRFVARHTKAGRELVQATSGMPAQRALQSTLSRLFAMDSEAAGIGPLRDMREDSRKLTEMIGSGISIADDSLKRNYRSITYQDLVDADRAGGDNNGTLTMQEVTKMLASVVSKSGVSAGYGGAGFTPGGALSGMDQAELYNRLGRTLDSLKELVDRINSKKKTERAD